MNKPIAWPVNLALQYRVSAGWLRPYVDGLADGVAVAFRCDSCDRTTFPPRRVCPCGGQAGSWRTLSGRGTVVASTTGRGTLPLSGDPQRLAFALIRLDGAENCTFGRLDAVTSHVVMGSRVRLTRSPQPAMFPTQAARFTAADGDPERANDD